MTNDDKTLKPGEELPEEEVVSDYVGKEVKDVLEGKTLEESMAEDPSAVTLKQYMEKLEQVKTPNAVEKIRLVRRLLMVLSEDADVPADKILIQKQSGINIGEAFGDHYAIDPLVFHALSEEKFDEICHYNLHEAIHVARDIANEGFTEYSASSLSNDKVRDSELLVQNVARVMKPIIEKKFGGNKNVAILRCLDLYEAKKYNEFHDLFIESYEGEDADRIFRLGFPELHFVAESDSWEVDEYEVERAESDVEIELAGESAPTEA